MTEDEEPLRSADPEGRNIVLDLTWDEALFLLWDVISLCAALLAAAEILGRIEVIRRIEGVVL